MDNDLSPKNGSPTGQEGYNHETEIDLVDLFYIFLGSWWKILLCLVAGAVLAFGITAGMITPQYQAVSKIYIVSASNDSVVNLADLQLGTSLTSDYKELMLSRPLLEDTIENLSLDVTSAQLANMIAITNPTDTRVLRIAVTCDDPQQAMDIANEIASQATVYLPKIMECKTPNQVEDAVLPSGAVSPSYPKNTLLGALIGLLLCCGVLMVRYMMDDSFSTPEDVQNYYGFQPLAVVPEGRLGDFNRDFTKKKKKRKKTEGAKV